MSNILIVDDEPIVRTFLERALEGPERRIITADGFETALRVTAGLDDLDLAFLDKNLFDGVGLELIEPLRRRCPFAEFIVITAYANVTAAVEALKHGVYDFLVKPLPELDRLELVVENALARSRLKREQARLSRELEASERRYDLVVRATTDGIWDWDLERGTLYLSPRWQSMLGYEDGSLTSSPEELLGRLHPEDRPQVEHVLEANLAGKSQVFVSEHRLRHKNGSWVWVLARGLAVRANGKALRIAGSHSDITARKEIEALLAHDAFHDRLTGLANRALLLDRIGRLLAQAQRERRRSFALLVLDLDQFNLLNDSLGYDHGDELLQLMGVRLAEGIRAADTAARLGNDRFGVLLGDASSRGQALQAADRLVSLAAKPLSIAGKEVVPSVSVGIALATSGYELAEDVLRDAELALKRAKALGKGSRAVFEDGMHPDADALLELENAFRDALKRRDLRPFYQPIVEAATGRIVGFEALVRWVHRERGVLSPASFLPWAESNGLIVELGRSVISQVMAQAAAWRTRLGDGVPCVSINISATHLLRPDFVSELRRELDACDVLPAQIELELTEGVLLESTAAAANALREIKKIGVGLALDDFGTGYASLSYLQQFPFDTLKIDRRFIANLTEDRTSEMLTRAIVGLASGLGLDVVAEGVENEAQLGQLRELGCGYAQGYLFAKPLPAEEAERLLVESAVVA